MVGPFNFDQDETNRMPSPTPERPKGWDVVRSENEDLHVVPCSDIDPHTICDLICGCGPFRDPETENLIIHNAFDGREIVERLEAGEDIA